MNDIALKNTFRLLLSIFLVLLSGCSLLQSSIFRGKAEFSSVASGGRLDIFKLLEGRTYYLLGEGVSCKSNTPERTAIKSWSKKVSFNNESMLVWGNICNDSVENINLKIVKDTIYIAPDMETIIFHGEKLIFYPKPPKLCDAGMWCPM